MGPKVIKPNPLNVKFDSPVGIAGLTIKTLEPRAGRYFRLTNRTLEPRYIIDNYICASKFVVLIQVHCPNEKCMSIKAYPRNGIVLNSTFTKKVIKGLPKNWDSN